MTRSISLYLCYTPDKLLGFVNFALSSKNQQVQKGEIPRLWGTLDVEHFHLVMWNSCSFNSILDCDLIATNFFVVKKPLLLLSGILVSCLVENFFPSFGCITSSGHMDYPSAPGVEAILQTCFMFRNRSAHSNFKAYRLPSIRKRVSANMTRCILRDAITDAVTDANWLVCVGSVVKHNCLILC